MKIVSALLLALALFFLFTERQAMFLLFSGFFGGCQSIMILKLPAFRQTLKMFGFKLEE